VPVSRPRVRAADGSGELPVPTYELFAGTEILGSMAMERMLAGLSTAVTRWAWSRSANESAPRRSRRASPRSRASSWR
jgi:hypothetical protein